MVPPGAVFHGEFADDDASALNEANSRFTLYNAAGSAITLTADDTVIVTDLLINSTAAVTVQVYSGADATVDAGEAVFNAALPVTTTLVQPLTTPHYCKKGTYPKVKTSGAGDVKLQIRGVIVRLGGP